MELPFLTHEGPRTRAAWRGGRSVSRAELVGDIVALAQRLPGQGPLVNLCRDRYRFTVALGAALLRGRLTLLPPSDTALVLSQLADDYPGSVVLCDGKAPATPAAPAAPAAPAPVFFVSENLDAPPHDGIPMIEGSRPAVVLFTSGSTGRSVGHMKSWEALAASAQAAGRAMKIGAFAGAAVVGTVPLQHSYGLESTVMLALQHGLALTAEHPFFPCDVIAALEARPAPRLLVTTPVHLRALLQDNRAPASADLLLSATAELSAELAQAAEAAFAAPLVEIYGCSEAGQIAQRRTARGEAWRCIDGLTLRQDETGTYVSGAPIVAGEVMLGDVVELLGEGRFALHGRLGDLVNIAGKRSSLAYLNVQLNAVEGVKDGVFIKPDGPDNGQTRLMAFAVAPGLTAQDILAALRRRIDPAFLPRPLCLVESLPRNALGKLPREAVSNLVKHAL